MKIALLAPASSIHVVKWFNSLNELGHQVHLISLHKPIPSNPALNYEERLHLLTTSSPIGYISNVTRLKQILNTIQPDILNVHYATGYGLLGRLCNFHPMLLSVWGSDIYEFPNKSCFHKNLLIRNLKSSDSIASTSTCMSIETQKLTPNSPIYVTPFPINTNLFKPSTEYEYKNTKTIRIGTVKGLKKIYGIDLLLNAFKIVNTQLPEYSFELCIAGAGSEHDKLIDLTKKLKLTNVNFIGLIPNSEVPHLLSTFDIFVALSRQESFGVALLEAGACGIPVVASEAEGFKEVIKNDITGLIVPIENHYAAAEAIIKLVQCPEKRKLIGEAACQFVSTEYSSDERKKKMIYQQN